MNQREIMDLMKDPKYWRDQDPDTVEIVREGFEKLYKEEQREEKLAEFLNDSTEIYWRETNVSDVTECIIKHWAQIKEIVEG